MASTREIVAQAVADAIAECAQRDHEFIHDVNVRLEHRGYTLHRLESPAPARFGSPPTFFREDG